MDTTQKKFVFFLILAVIVGMLVAIKWLQNTQVEKVVKVGQVELKVGIADTDEEKSRGLAGRDSLAADAGMMFVFSSTGRSASGGDQTGQYGFWMKGMKFPLDFVWIRQGRVVEVTENVSLEDQTRVYQPKEPIDTMLEVNAGWAARHGVKVGDEVVVE